MKYFTSLLLGLSLIACGDKDEDGIDDAIDCNIDDPSIEASSPTTFFQDADGDGFGSDVLTTIACTQPDGYVTDNTDCDDSNGDVHPDAIEICDELDNNCDNTIDSDATEGLTTVYQDADGDGFGNSIIEEEVCTIEAGWVEDSSDCDDANAEINPDATEICDGIDNDCDASIDVDDDSVEGAITVYADTDEDGFGDANVSSEACAVDDGWVENADDCDDSQEKINPEAEELLGDGVDQDCDELELCYEDSDGDGFGSGDFILIQANAGGVFSCAADFTSSENSLDCDDANATIHPNAVEICDSGVDNDCDSLIDDQDDSLDTSTGSSFYVDQDQDGYGSATEILSCEQGSHATNMDDCNDSLASSNPMATDIVGDGIDQNCDETDGTDFDQDGFASVISGGTDCDDSDATINPDATEICDSGIDNDCDSLIDDQDDSLDLNSTTTLYLDADADGFGNDADTFHSCNGSETGYVVDNTDCDDENEFTYPGAAQLQSLTECLTDEDGDGWSSTDLGTGLADCDDSDAALNPDATEICDGIDQNCDGDIDEGLLVELYLDMDGDGYGAETPDMVCDDAEGYVADNTDCDDSLASSNPMATDIVGDGVDQNCDGSDGTDADQDGFVSVISGGLDCDDSDATINPDATEICDSGIDNDCDSLIDDQDDSLDTNGATLLYADWDQDGFGNDLEIFASCTVTAVGYVDDNTDCDDLDEFTYPGVAFNQSLTECLTDYDGDGWSETDLGDGFTDCDDWDIAVNPAAAEICDELDNNCDGDIDEGVQVERYADSDNDGYGAEIGEMVCADTAGYVDNNEDCNDSQASYNPLVTDISGDGFDQNCDGSDGTDADQDGFISEASGGDDCDDNDELTFPGAADLDSTDDCMRDSDDDGYGDVDTEGTIIAGTDCEDDMADVNIDGTEIWYDGIDGDCNWGSDFDQDEDGDDIEELDCDGDGVTETECDLDGDGVSDYIAGSDCDDEDDGFNQFVAEVWFDGIDQNCDDLSDFDSDMDGDDIIELDCDEDGNFETSCDLDGDGIDDFIGGSDCDDFDASLSSLDLDSDGISSCDGDCWDSEEDGDGDGAPDSATTYPGAAFNDSGTLCLPDDDGDGYSPLAADAGMCLDFTTHDTYGDGWNGNALEIYENDVLTGTIENENLDSSSGATAGGEYNYHTHCLEPTSTSFVLKYIDGDFNNEVSFEMFDDQGNLLADGQGSGSNNLTVNSVLYEAEDIVFTYNFEGTDCDDSDATVYLGTDNDGDGYFACDDDCDDHDVNIYLGAAQTYYDGVDQACYGLSDYDQDEDGDDIAELDCLGDGNFASECDFDGDGTIDWIGGTDCDDEDPTVEGLDVDGDGFSTCDSDCDDSDADSYPSADEVWYDGIDQNCDGLSDYDQDEDGIDSVDHGGEDCDDLDASVGATDEDGDGFIECIDDCNDDPNDGGAGINPDAEDECGDGIDQDCDGAFVQCYASCQEYYDAGFTTSDTYRILLPSLVNYDVYCDMDVDNGGWTLVGSSLDATMNDEASAYYSDLAAATPTADHTGVWDGLRGYTNGDIRFTCNAGGNEVDLSFYANGWYDVITTGTDAESCFNDSNGNGVIEAVPPERRNNINGATRPLGDEWNQGYIEGEDSCIASDDFTVDFDNRGMDGIENDGTDWGEDDGTKKCGNVANVSTGYWQIWVR